VVLYPRLVLTSSTLQIPGKPKYTNGQTCPAGTPDAGKHGQLEIKMWPSFTPPGSNHPVVVHDPGAIKLADGQLITVAFVPPGASIPKPSSITAMLTDRAGSATTPPTSTPTLTPTTAPSTATTAPSSATTATTAPSTGSTLPSPTRTTATTAPPTTATTKAR
jgi:hypothetical protein